MMTEKEKVKKKWWEPIPYEEGNEYGMEIGSNNWLCDHLGDAQENMDALWKHINSLQSQLAEAREVIEFYGEEANYDNKPIKSNKYDIRCCLLFDLSLPRGTGVNHPTPKDMWRVGGKRARAYLEKYKQERGK